MINQPRAFFALDLGSATMSGALLGHIGGRWRLIAHAAAPSSVDVDAALVRLLARLKLTDPQMLTELGAAEDAEILTLVATWPRLVARTAPQRRIAVLAGSRRQRRRLETSASRAGWLVVGGSADEDDYVALSRLALTSEIDAVLLGADEDPGGDEKRHLPDLAALVAAVAQSRPELTVMLAGGAAAYGSAFAVVSDARPGREPTAPIRAVAEASGTVQVEASVEKTTADTKLASTKAAAAEEPAVAAKSEAAESARPDGATADGSVADGLPPDGEAQEPGVGAEVPAEAPAAEVGSTLVAPVAARDSIPPAFQAADRPASPHVLLVPDAGAGHPAGASLQQVLEGLRISPNDSRLGVALSIASLAYVLDRSIEVVEIGLQGGLWSRSEPVGQGHLSVASSHVCLADASFAPENPSEEVIDGVLAWSTTPLDRHRAMDRLNDLRLVPWGEADGDGAVFRLAAAKAAIGRLVESSPAMVASPMPELLVAAGGVFSALPPSVVALALADLVRRFGVSHLAIDQARLLGPLGAVEDEQERRRLLANLADDILLPLGGLILPAGVRTGHSAGRLRLKGASSASEIELHPGMVEVVDLPPGRSARADLDFRDAVRLVNRSRHFSVDVEGGLCGLLVDLRDVPMRISDRPDSRRAALEAWQRGMWPEIDE
ncbi:MAG TPA: hypothetical protein VGE81_02325 [Candidatus Limnocylindrales bacterium]